MPFYDDQISLYLNLATSKTRDAGGKLRWLTGTDKEIPVGASESQETQCMIFGNCVWIANNQDVDTDFQFTLLNYLDIHTYAKLKEHVEANQHLVLPTFNNNYLISNDSKPGEKLLARITGTVNGVAAPAGTAIARGNSPMSCSRYKLSSGRQPALDGIVFVTGSYDGSGGEKEHAEQKLLAALGNYLKKGTLLDSKSLSFSGCKSACSTCKRVLTAVQSRLRVGASRNRLFFDEPELAQMRIDAGMSAAHPSGIKELNIDAYFPS